MSKLKLPDVSLVLIETLDHQLGRLAVNECVRKVDFGDILIFTDEPDLFSPLDTDMKVRFVKVENWADKIGWSRCSWFDIPQHMATSHGLTIQWDSWIHDVSMWRDEFLEYDICGAVWGWHPDRKVGNLGFGLRSQRLMKYVYLHRYDYPCTTSVDDDLLCRTYRPRLEEVGFVWAPERLAWEFAFECSPPRATFGFHAAHNFGHVLEHDELLARARLMLASPYISKSYMMKQFADANPDIVRELAAEFKDSESNAEEGGHRG
jgi:hypothetical protein